MGGGQNQLLMMPKSNTFFPLRACTACTPTDTDESLVDILVPCFVSIGHALRQLHHSIQQSPPPVSGTGKSKLAVDGTWLSLGLFVDTINYSLEQKLSGNDPSAFLKQAACTELVIVPSYLCDKQWRMVFICSSIAAEIWWVPSISLFILWPSVPGLSSLLCLHLSVDPSFSLP